MADNIAALLAGAAKTNADFDFSKIANSYWAGLDEAYKRRTQDAFMGPDVLGPDGQIDPYKMLQKAAKVGGLPAAEHLKSLFETGVLQQRQQAGSEVQRELDGPQGNPQQQQSSLPRSINGPPATVTEPVTTPRTTLRPQLQSQQQPQTPFTQFLTAQGIPPEQQTDEALKLQQGFMQLTGRPFDTSKQLNMADADTRQVLGKYVLARAGQGQQPQASLATQIGPAGPVTQPGPAAAMAQQSPIVPQVGPQLPQVAPPPQTPQAVPSQAPATPVPTQQPIVPRSVQTVPIQQPGSTANDPSLGGIVSPAEIQRFGSWQNAYDVYQRALRRPEGLPPAMQADLEKKVAAIREQLKFTETQKDYEYQKARDPNISPFPQWQDEQKAREGRVRADSAVAEELSKNSAQIRTTLPILQQVAELAKSAPGGQAGVIAAKLAPIMSALGMKVPSNISDAEALNSTVFRLLPLVRQPGSVSNYEQQSYLSALPSLSLSKEGRAKAVDMMLRLANRGIAVADLYRDNIGAVDLNKKLAALDTPVFTQDESEQLKIIVNKARGDNIGWTEVKPGVRMRTRDAGQQ
jgi:hypothetical protein